MLKVKRIKVTLFFKREIRQIIFAWFFFQKFLCLRIFKGNIKIITYYPNRKLKLDFYYLGRVIKCILYIFQISKP